MIITAASRPPSQHYSASSTPTLRARARTTLAEWPSSTISGDERPLSHPISAVVQRRADTCSFDVPGCEAEPQPVSV
jgi:hypothetical protein